VPDNASPDAEDRWRDLRRFLLFAYSAVLLWSIFVWGLPIDRLLVLTWMGVAFGLGAIGRSRADVKQMAKDWVALVVVYIVYDYSRGTADQLGIPVNYTLPGQLDRILFLGRNPNVALQWRLYDPGDVKWYDVLGSIIYMTHFVLPVVPPGCSTCGGSPSPSTSRLRASSSSPRRRRGCPPATATPTRSRASPAAAGGRSA
jgi:hypothetical protein